MAEQIELHMSTTGIAPVVTSELIRRSFLRSIHIEALHPGFARAYNRRERGLTRYW